jgi:transposase
VHSDRWHAYDRVPEDRRQACWAHLKRDFQKVADGGGPSEAVGRRGLRLVRELFAAWRAFRAGTIPRARLQELLAPLQRRLSLRKSAAARRRAEIAQPRDGEAHLNKNGLEGVFRHVCSL